MPQDGVGVVELALRLGVHHKTVQKYRDTPEFPEWSRAHDPEGLVWVWCPNIKRFMPEREV